MAAHCHALGADARTRRDDDPDGPALLALSDDAKTTGESLVTACSAVILALVAAALAHLVLAIRRRGLPEELRSIVRGGEGCRCASSVKDDEDRRRMS